MMVAENIMSSVDNKGKMFALVLSEIEDHRSGNDALLRIKGGWYTTKSGVKKQIQTTKGWELLVA